MSKFDWLFEKKKLENEKFYAKMDLSYMPKEAWLKAYANVADEVLREERIDAFFEWLFFKVIFVLMVAFFVIFLLVVIK